MTNSESLQLNDKFSSQVGHFNWGEKTGPSTTMFLVQDCWVSVEDTITI